MATPWWVGGGSWNGQWQDTGDRDWPFAPVTVTTISRTINTEAARTRDPGGREGGGHTLPSVVAGTGISASTSHAG